MRLLRTINLGAAVAMSLLAVLGCKSLEERTLPRPVVATPLELDPTEDYELSRWWSNGKQLLRLDDNAAYALYEGQNRYAKPIERGRWSQQSYAVLWLEPYDNHGPRPQRVQVTKRQGELALIVGKLQPLRALETPPSAPEDQLIGSWRGAMGSLRLEPTMRYSLRPVEGAVIDPNESTPIIAGHAGRWSVSEGAILLQPDTPAVNPIRLQIRQQNERVTLTGPAGELQPVTS